MRIIGGKYRGRGISPPRNIKARPTTDFAREGLFNILANSFDFSTLSVLDLFSGTGSISYEFASRGASHVELVEIERVNFRFITDTVRKLGFTSIRPHNCDVRSYLQRGSGSFDIIFADPPYDLPWGGDIPEMVKKSGLLHIEGLLIVEHSARSTPGLSDYIVDRRRYGNVNFTFFRFPQNEIAG